MSKLNCRMCIYINGSRQGFPISIILQHYSTASCTGITSCKILTVISDNIGLMWWKVCV